MNLSINFEQFLLSITRSRKLQNSTTSQSLQYI